VCSSVLWTNIGALTAFSRVVLHVELDNRRRALGVAANTAIPSCGRHAYPCEKVRFAGRLLRFDLSCATSLIV